MNFKDTQVEDLSEEEKDVIRLFRSMGGQHGIEYAKNHIEFTDGIATTWLYSESEFVVDIFSKALHWEDDNLIDYFRRRAADHGIY